MMPHTIRQQTLDIQIDSEAAALALQSQIGDINRQRLLPVIERVLDEFTVPERRIRIARLQVDLGELPLDHFADAAEDALAAALRRALEQALRDASDDAAANSRIEPQEASRLELLEQYLLRGVLPFWASGESFSVDSLLQQLSHDDPAGLVALICRHAYDRRVLERIVLQLGGATLQRLLYLLTPEHAALILAYMLDLNRIHRVELLLSLRDTAFENLLWILVLSYLLRDAGSQFNRRSFLRWLLEGLAESESLDYPQLVETLRRGLRQMKQHRAPTSSLPAALDELLQELRDEGVVFADDGCEPPLIDGLPDISLPSDRTSEEQLLRFLHEYPDALRDFIRRYGRDARQIGRLVDRLSEATLIRLLDLLDAEHAALILAYLLDIRSVHRVTPLVALNDRRFDRLLWVLVLSYVIDNPGSQFNRKSLVLSLLQGMAQSEGLDLADLIETLRRGLAAIETHLSSATSLPAIIRELAGDVFAPGDGDQASPDGFAAYDPAEILRHVLRTGRLPWNPPSPQDEAEARRRLDEVTQLPPATLRAIFAAAPIRDPAAIARHLARALPEAALLALLRRLLPAEAEAGPFRASLAHFAGQAADRRAFHAGIVVALAAGDAIDFERWASFASGGATAAGTLLPGLLPGAGPAALQAMLMPQGHVEPPASAASRRQVALDFLRGERAQQGSAADGDGSLWHTVPDDVIADALSEALDDDTEAVGDLVRQRVTDPRQRERWIKVLPGTMMARLSQTIEPARHHALLGAAEILVTAWRQAAPHGAGTVSAHAQLWNMLFDFLAAHRGLDRSVEQLVADFLARAAALGEDFAARLREQANTLAAAAGDRRLIAALSHDKPAKPAMAGAEPAARTTERAPDPAAPRSARPKGRLNMKTAFGLAEEDDRTRGDPIYIGNAGLVLTAAFLPHLFRELDLLGADDDKRPRLHDRDAVSRAVHLLQYLVDGRTDAPEPLLVLNKLLCGVPTATPVARAIAMTEAEQQLCDQLLRAILANWTILKGTTVAGLRETFLQREGKLQRVDDGWKLRVQRKTLDVLVDQVPWSISILLAPWMPAAVHVTW